jgi:hypothetical protein
MTLSESVIRAASLKAQKRGRMEGQTASGLSDLDLSVGSSEQAHNLNAAESGSPVGLRILNSINRTIVSAFAPRDN